MSNAIRLLRSYAASKVRGVVEAYKHFTPCEVKNSIPVNFSYRTQHIRRLRQDHVFELRRIGNEGIEGGDAADGSVEVCEQLIRNTRGDLCAITPRERVFVSNNHP